MSLIRPSPEKKGPHGPRRIPKGATPQQLLNKLQKDFLAKGLDAYTQFKKLGAGIDHDEDGNEINDNPKIKKADDDDDDLIDPKIPKWRSDQGDDKKFLEIREIEGYMTRIQKIKHTQQMKGGGTASALRDRETGSKTREPEK